MNLLTLVSSLCSPCPLLLSVSNIGSCEMLVGRVECCPTFCPDGGGIDETSVCASDILSMVEELITVLLDDGLDDDYG